MKNNNATKEFNRKGMKKVLDKAAEIAKEEMNQKIHMDLEIAAMDTLTTSNVTNFIVVNSINAAIKRCKKEEVIIALERLVIEAYQLAC